MRLVLRMGVLALVTATAGCIPIPIYVGRVPVGGNQPVRSASVARSEIAAMMSASAAAWNRGDLNAFMADYEQSDSTTYIGRRGIVRGVAAIRAVYAPRFAPGVARDSLSFRNLEVDLVAPSVVNAIAEYVLMRGDSVTARGPTSLVMRKSGGRWRIAHDHSS